MNFRGRKFRFWYYTASHSQALIRSLGLSGENNIDLYFGDVSYIEVPDLLVNLTIEETTISDKEYLDTKLRQNNSLENITVLSSENRKFYVVSGSRRLSENKLAFSKLPFDCNFM
ncbi:MAG: hypothetical protein IJF07_04320 [Lachnospiraceae bacterium]|nr:hypothetical protein [Lachnospiraceae bacterium]